MKKIIFSVVFLAGMFTQNYLYGQLEYKGYIDAFPILENSWMNEPKISLRNDLASINEWVSDISIYNEDLSFYTAFKASTLTSYAYNSFGWLYNNDRKEFYTTQTFFNDDDLMEFVVYETGTLGRLGSFAIINENGDVLFEEPGRFGGKFFLFEIGAKKYFFAKTLTTERDVFLIYEVTDGTVVNEFEPLLTRVNAFPNPATEYIDIIYQIGGQNPQVMTIANMSGQVITTVQLDPAKEQYRLEVSGYVPGMYIYSYGTVSGKFVVK